jgi:triosephosphate isomerase
MRKKIVAGNWKMNCTLQETEELIAGLAGKVASTEDKTIIVSPPFTNLYLAKQLTANKGIEVAAQNVHEAKNGAFTGEISTAMLNSLGVNYAIVGHSERRAIYGEGDALLAKKVDASIAANITPIFCIGEELATRKENKHFDLVEQQLKDGLFHLEATDFLKVIIAYEPVWAIGTGETASPEQAQEIHAHIRSLLVQKYGNEVAAQTSILYGGSVKPDNAKEIFAKPDVDGGLIGGASLKAADFIAIAEAF